MYNITIADVEGVHYRSSTGLRCSSIKLRHCAYSYLFLILTLENTCTKKCVFLLCFIMALIYLFLILIILLAKIPVHENVYFYFIFYTSMLICRIDNDIGPDQICVYVPTLYIYFYIKLLFILFVPMSRSGR